MALTDTIESIEARATIRRSRSGDRVANLNMQPRRIARPDGEIGAGASRIARCTIRRKGTVILGRPIYAPEQQTEE